MVAEEEGGEVEEGGEAEEGEEEQRESAAPQTGNSFSSVVLLLLLNFSFV